MCKCFLENKSMCLPSSSYDVSQYQIKSFFTMQIENILLMMMIMMMIWIKILNPIKKHPQPYQNGCSYCCTYLRCSHNISQLEIPTMVEFSTSNSCNLMGNIEYFHSQYKQFPILILHVESSPSEHGYYSNPAFSVSVGHDN